MNEQPTPTRPNREIIERKPVESVAKKLEGQGLSPMLSRLFASRGVSDASEVRAGLADLLPIDSLRNAREMGALLADCADDRSRVLIVSDYDCDGATACSVLIKSFAAANLNFGHLVPDRFKHGYGLTPSIVDEAAALVPKPKFIVTVDNGISSKAGVERARELGIEVLVTDHHLCPKEADDLPKARLIVNPQHPQCSFKSKAIAGCGVAWYVASAFHDALVARGKKPGFEPIELLPYVALGTVADVVQLDVNNRILVREGLNRIRQGLCSPGIKLLADVSKKDVATLTCRDIGFSLGPRINAAGRLAHMSAGIECLTTSDPERASELAFRLHETNAERREIQKTIIEQAEGMLSRPFLELADRGQVSTHSIVVYAPDWHEGVVGIVAGRLKDNMYRPTFVLTDSSEGDIKGSGRSIDGFHLKHALDHINIEFPGLLLKFGGHAAAAGITIAKGRIEEFKTAFEQICRADLTEELLTECLRHDGALPTYAYNELTISEMQREVWGQGFAEPIFIDRFDVANRKTMGAEQQHLKLIVKKGSGIYDAVSWGNGDRIDLVPNQVECLFKPGLNHYRGATSVQLMTEELLNVPTLELSVVEKARAAQDSATVVTPAKAPARPAMRI